MGAFDAARELDPLNDAGAAELDRRILHGPLEVVSVGTLAGRIRRDEASVRRLVGLPVSDEAPDVGADLPADDPGTLVLELAAAPGVLRARLLHVLAVIGPPPHKVSIRLVLEHVTDEADRSDAEDALMHMAGVAVARESLLGIRASRPAPDEARERATVAAGETRIGRRDARARERDAALATLTTQLRDAEALRVPVGWLDFHEVALDTVPDVVTTTWRSPPPAGAEPGFGRGEGASLLLVAGGVVATPIAAIVADLAAVGIAVSATGIGAVGLAGASWLGMRRAGRRERRERERIEAGDPATSGRLRVVHAAGDPGTIVSLVHAGPDPAEEFGDTRIVRVVDQRTAPSGDRDALLEAVDDLTLRARITNDQIDALAGDRSRVRALGTAVDPSRT